MSTATRPEPVDNGVNAAALMDAREALTDAPEAKRFQSMRAFTKVVYLNSVITSDASE